MFATLYVQFRAKYFCFTYFSNMLSAVKLRVLGLMAYWYTGSAFHQINSIIFICGLARCLDPLHPFSRATAEAFPYWVIFCGKKIPKLHAYTGLVQLYDSHV